MGAEKEPDMSLKKEIGAIGENGITNITEIGKRVDILKGISPVTNAKELISGDNATILLALLYKGNAWDKQKVNLSGKGKEEEKSLYDEYKRIFGVKQIVFDKESFMYKTNIDTKVLGFSKGELSKDKPSILELLPDGINVKLEGGDYKGFQTIKGNNITIEPLSGASVNFVGSTVDEIRDYINSNPERLANYNKQISDRNNLIKERNPQIEIRNEERKQKAKELGKAPELIQTYKPYSIEEYLSDTPILNITGNGVVIRGCKFSKLGGMEKGQTGIRIGGTIDVKTGKIEGGKNITLEGNTFDGTKRGIVSIYAENFIIRNNNLKPDEDAIFFNTFPPYGGVIEGNTIKMEDKIVNGEVIAHRDAIQGVPIDPTGKGRSQFKGAEGSGVKIFGNHLYLGSKSQGIFMIDGRLGESEISNNNFNYSGTTTDDGSFKHLISIGGVKDSVIISGNTFKGYKSPTLLLVPPRILNEANYRMDNFSRISNDPKAPFFIFMKDLEAGKYGILADNYKNSIEGGNTSTLGKIKIITSWDEYFNRDKKTSKKDIDQITELDDSSALFVLEKAILDAAQIKKDKKGNYVDISGEVLNEKERKKLESEVKLEDLKEDVIFSFGRKIIDKVLKDGKASQIIKTPREAEIFQKYVEFMREAGLRELTGITLASDVQLARESFDSLWVALRQFGVQKRKNLVAKNITINDVKKELPEKDQVMLFQMWINMEGIKTDIDGKHETVGNFIQKDRIESLKKVSTLYINYLKNKLRVGDIKTIKNKKGRLSSEEKYALKVDEAQTVFNQLGNETGIINIEEKIKKIFINENEAHGMGATNPNNALNTLVTQMQNILLNPKGFDEKDFNEIFKQIYEIDSKKFMELGSADGAGESINNNTGNLLNELAGNNKLKDIGKNLEFYLKNLEQINTNVLAYLKNNQKDEFIKYFSSVVFGIKIPSEGIANSIIYSVISTDLEKAYDLGVSMYKGEDSKNSYKKSLFKEKKDLEKLESNGTITEKGQERLKKLKTLTLHNGWNKDFDSEFDAVVGTSVTLALGNSVIYNTLNDNSKLIEEESKKGGLYYTNLISSLNGAGSYIGFETKQELLNTSSILVIGAISYGVGFGVGGLVTGATRGALVRGFGEKVATNFVSKLGIYSTGAVASVIGQAGINAGLNGTDFDKWEFSGKQFFIDVLGVGLLGKIYSLKSMNFSEKATVGNYIKVIGGRTVLSTGAYIGLDLAVSRLFGEYQKISIEQFALGLAFSAGFEGAFGRKITDPNLQVRIEGEGDKSVLVVKEGNEEKRYTIEELRTLMKKGKVEDNNGGGAKIDRSFARNNVESSSKKVIFNRSSLREHILFGNNDLTGAYQGLHLYDPFNLSKLNVSIEVLSISNNGVLKVLVDNGNPFKTEKTFFPLGFKYEHIETILDSVEKTINSNSDLSRGVNSNPRGNRKMSITANVIYNNKSFYISIVYKKASRGGLEIISIVPKESAGNAVRNVVNIGDVNLGVISEIPLQNYSFGKSRLEFIRNNKDLINRNVNIENVYEKFQSYYDFFNNPNSENGTFYNGSKRINIDENDAGLLLDIHNLSPVQMELKKARAKTFLIGKFLPANEVDLIVFRMLDLGLLGGPKIIKRDIKFEYSELKDHIMTGYAGNKYLTGLHIYSEGVFGELGLSPGPASMQDNGVFSTPIYKKTEREKRNYGVKYFFPLGFEYAHIETLISKVTENINQNSQLKTAILKSNGKVSLGITIKYNNKKFNAGIILKKNNDGKSFKIVTIYPKGRSEIKNKVGEVGEIDLGNINIPNYSSFSYLKTRLPYARGEELKWLRDKNKGLSDADRKVAIQDFFLGRGDFEGLYPSSKTVANISDTDLSFFIDIHKLDVETEIQLKKNKMTGRLLTYGIPENEVVPVLNQMLDLGLLGDAGFINSLTYKSVSDIKDEKVKGAYIKMLNTFTDSLGKAKNFISSGIEAGDVFRTLLNDIFTGTNKIYNNAVIGGIPKFMENDLLGMYLNLATSKKLTLGESCMTSGGGCHERSIFISKLGQELGFQTKILAVSSDTRTHSFVLLKGIQKVFIVDLAYSKDNLVREATSTELSKLRLTKADIDKAFNSGDSSVGKNKFYTSESFREHERLFPVIHFEGQNLLFEYDGRTVFNLKIDTDNRIFLEEALKLGNYNNKSILDFLEYTTFYSIGESNKSVLIDKLDNSAFYKLLRIPEPKNGISNDSLIQKYRELSKKQNTSEIAQNKLLLDQGEISRRIRIVVTSRQFSQNPGNIGELLSKGVSSLDKVSQILREGGIPENMIIPLRDRLEDLGLLRIGNNGGFHEKPINLNSINNSSKTPLFSLGTVLPIEHKLTNWKIGPEYLHGKIVADIGSGASTFPEDLIMKGVSMVTAVDPVYHTAGTFKTKNNETRALAKKILSDTNATPEAKANARNMLEVLKGAEQRVLGRTGKINNKSSHKDLEEKSQDIIFMNNMLLGVSDYDTFFKEVAGKLKEDGKIYIAEYESNEKFYEYFKSKGKLKNTKEDNNGQIYYVLDKNEVL